MNRRAFFLAPLALPGVAAAMALPKPKSAALTVTVDLEAETRAILARVQETLDATRRTQAEAISRLVTPNELRAKYGLPEIESTFGVDCAEGQLLIRGLP